LLANIQDQIWTFGEIIGRLAEDIEIAARVRLANKLAPSNNAPVKMINKLVTIRATSQGRSSGS